MSRIGNTPIRIPDTVTVTKSDGEVLIKGPKGELSCVVDSGLTISIDNSVITVTCTKPGKKYTAKHGSLRANITNSIHGVLDGWTKTLELSGVGYRAAVNGANLVLTVGFSHPVTIVPPAGIAFSVKENSIVVSGTDKQLVGQVAANIREVKKPEPYKGKGIKYQHEYIRKKAGKAKAIGGAPGSA